MNSSGSLDKSEVLNVIRFLASGGKGFYARLLARIYSDPHTGESLLQAIVESRPADYVDVMFAANTIAA